MTLNPADTTNWDLIRTGSPIDPFIRTISHAKPQTEVTLESTSSSDAASSFSRIAADLPPMPFPIDSSSTVEEVDMARQALYQVLNQSRFIPESHKETYRERFEKLAKEHQAAKMRADLEAKLGGEKKNVATDGAQRVLASRHDTTMSDLPTTPKHGPKATTAHMRSNVIAPLIESTQPGPQQKVTFTAATPASIAKAKPDKPASQKKNNKNGGARPKKSNHSFAALPDVRTKKRPTQAEIIKAAKSEVEQAKADNPIAATKPVTTGPGTPSQNAAEVSLPSCQGGIADVVYAVGD